VLSVKALLLRVGFDFYVAAFENVSKEAFLALQEADLQELGVQDADHLQVFGSLQDHLRSKQDPLTWQPGDVVAWLRAEGEEHIADMFGAVCGERLRQLAGFDLLNLGLISRKDRVRVSRKIGQLFGEDRSQHAVGLGGSSKSDESDKRAQPQHDRQPPHPAGIVAGWPCRPAEADEPAAEALVPCQVEVIMVYLGMELPSVIPTSCSMLQLRRLVKRWLDAHGVVMDRLALYQHTPEGNRCLRTDTDLRAVLTQGGEPPVLLLEF